MKKTLLLSVGIALMTTACGPADTAETEVPGLEQNHGALYGEVQKVVGDTPCPTGYSIATPNDALANQSTICGKMGVWDIARLSGSGAMKGPGYGCAITSYESAPLGNTLCKLPGQTNLVEVVGDSPCGAGRTLLTPQEARSQQSAVCAKLGMWDIARLEGGGAMKGSGYGCVITDQETQKLGHALCKSLN
ncbi:hypothetical protein [Cystobacter fuscus]|uniref:hypothetical protein n=1 Tax=Cystobacter fuscus TaxID=43 RepID=UPI002B30EF37|nr:hypothetical protein F0U63_01415 [Cystobacter fuscus]